MHALLLRLLRKLLPGRLLLVLLLRLRRPHLQLLLVLLLLALPVQLLLLAQLPLRPRARARPRPAAEVRRRAVRARARRGRRLEGRRQRLDLVRLEQLRRVVPAEHDAEDVVALRAADARDARWVPLLVARVPREALVARRPRLPRPPLLVMLRARRRTRMRLRRRRCRLLLCFRLVRPAGLCERGLGELDELLELGHELGELLVLRVGRQRLLHLRELHLVCLELRCVHRVFSDLYFVSVSISCASRLYLVVMQRCEAI